ncbi:MAG TPA: hypothetical protein VIM41_16795, partial [Gammaproteobacteria bacterium]
MFLQRRRISNPAIIFCISILATFLLPSNEASAVPAFARQMQMECSGCHFQHFPKLNAFGRSFKASGLSQTSQSTLDGENLSIPPNLNASFFMRSKYTDLKTDTNDPRGVWEVPEEAAILLGGRMADGIGGIVEWGGPLLSAKISMTTEMGPARAGMTLFTTDGLGAAYGFELMNTGAVRNHRPFERSSKPTLGNNPELELADAATGLAFHAADTHWFVNATLFIPDSPEAGYSEMDASGNLAQYFRAAWLPSFGGWDMGIGGGVYAGKARVTTVDTGAGLDAFDNVPGL